MENKLRNRIIVQIIFWICISGILFVFASHIYPYRIAFFAAFTSVCVYSFAMYFNAMIIFPKLYHYKRSFLYLLIVFIFIIILASLLTHIENTYFIQYFETTYHKNPPPNEAKFFKSFFWLFLVNSVGIIYLVQQKLLDHEEENKLIIEEKLNTELQLLKAQINPHFLFNALNNIYSLSYKKSEKAPESILQLSKMLRYVIDDCKNETVSLKSEIEYIESFIAFQKMKSPHAQSILFDYSELNQNLRVSPLLFIPFIENSFKYSRIDEDVDAFIAIRISSDKKNNLEFIIENSIPKTSKVDSGTGTGIINVKQRLNHIYKNKYMLDIDKKTNRYRVFLKLDEL